MTEYERGYAEGAAAERERCAALCDELCHHLTRKCNAEFETPCVACDCAEAIRQPAELKAADDQAYQDAQAYWEEHLPSKPATPGREGE